MALRTLLESLSHQRSKVKRPKGMRPENFDNSEPDHVRVVYNGARGLGSFEKFSTEMLDSILRNEKPLRELLVQNGLTRYKQ